MYSKSIQKKTSTDFNAKVTNYLRDKAMKEKTAENKSTEFPAGV
jgi:hypothetical protein